VERKSPNKAKLHAGSTFSAKIISSQQSLSAAFTGEDNFSSILKLYLEYLQSTYVTGFWKITHMGANDTVNI